VRITLLLALVACGPPKLAYWTTASDRIDWATPARTPMASDGTCRASLRVRVVDEHDAPVAGAEVILRRTEHLSAPSTVPVDLTYQTEAVRTNNRGEAVTCRIDSIPDTKDLFGSLRGGELRARLADKTGSLAAPFASPPVIVLR
jgi:hypothetical protein